MERKEVSSQAGGGKVTNGKIWCTERVGEKERKVIGDVSKKD